MKNEMIAYFGYGSLVNLASLRTPYISAHRARLSGWRRVWLTRPAVEGSFAPVSNLAFLSVEPCARTTIEGLIIIDRRESLPSLDEREVLYNRVTLPPWSVEFLDEAPDHDLESFIYVAQQPPATNCAQIVRSYLDVVMQGYHHQFGHAGVENFLKTTKNFCLSIREDRDAPLYPRSVQLDAEERTIFERLVPSQT